MASEDAADGPPLTKTVIAASLSGCLGKVATHPLDTLKAQLQVDVAKPGASAEGFAKLRKLLQRSSLRSVYSGYTVAVLGSLPAGGLYLTSYEVLRPKLQARIPSKFASDFSAGLAAEAISCLLWCPIDIVKERLQVQRDMKGLYHYDGPIDAVRQILRSEGILGLYRAYGATLAAFGPQTAINLATYEQIEQRAIAWYHDTSDTLGADGKPKPIPPWLNFSCAAASGLAAAVVTTPLDLGKLRMQVVRASRNAARSGEKPVEQPFNYANIADALIQIARNEGFPALFRGALLRCVVWVPQTAIMLSAFKIILARL